VQERELELYDVWKEVWEIRIPFHYSRLQKSCNKQAEQWKTTIGLNREVGLAEAGKIIRFIRGKSIVVFHCSAGFVARLLQSAVQPNLPEKVPVRVVYFICGKKPESVFQALETTIDINGGSRYSCMCERRNIWNQNLFHCNLTSQKTKSLDTSTLHQHYFKTPQSFHLTHLI